MSTYVFQATDAVNGTELWITDGTDAGTMLLKDIYAGTTNSTPQAFSGWRTARCCFPPLMRLVVANCG